MFCYTEDHRIWRFGQTFYKFQTIWMGLPWLNCGALVARLFRVQASIQSVKASVSFAPFLALCSKSTCFSPWFCVSRPSQYNMISFEFNLICGFFAFFKLIVWADGINECGWCLGGGRGFWLKATHPMPSVSWIFHHSLHVLINYIVLIVPGILCPL